MFEIPSDIHRRNVYSLSQKILFENSFFIMSRCLCLLPFQNARVFLWFEPMHGHVYAVTVSMSSYVNQFILQDRSQTQE